MPKSSLEISPETDLEAIHNVLFIGEVSIGALNIDKGDIIYNATLNNCIIGDFCKIKNVTGEISGAKIGDCVTIENVGRIVFEQEARCGLGLEVAVLDETGSRPVTIYPGLTAQIASMITHRPKWNETEYAHMLDEWILSSPKTIKQLQGKICDNVVIKDTINIRNVGIDHDVNICGAFLLEDGMIINNSTAVEPFSYIGTGVNVVGFIIEDGKVDGGAYLRRCYVGQGTVIDKGFTAHDSLFFANCTMECGEACAVFAGPFSVSMHKSSLLIGGSNVVYERRKCYEFFKSHV